MGVQLGQKRVRQIGRVALTYAGSVKNPPATQEIWLDPWIMKILWRGKWQPTPGFLPGESQEQKYSPGGHKALDMTQLLALSHVKYMANWEAAV